MRQTLVRAPNAMSAWGHKSDAFAMMEADLFIPSPPN